MLKQLIVCGVVVYMCGCRNGVYKITPSEAEQYSAGCLSFVECSSWDDYDLPTNQLPIRVERNLGACTDKPSEIGSTVLWAITFGIIPRHDGQEKSGEIVVRSPLGLKIGSYKIEACNWTGLLPAFMDYPESGEERAPHAVLPNCQLEAKIQHRMIKNLVDGFSQDEYLNSLASHSFTAFPNGMQV